MYDEWYLQQFDTFNDSYSSQWEIFGLKHRSNETRLGCVRAVASREVLNWVVDQRPNRANSVPPNGDIHSTSLQLLYCPHVLKISPSDGGTDRFTRHRDHGIFEIKPWFMSLPKSVFQRLSEAMMLPFSYFFLRTNAGGSGDYAKYSTFEDNGMIATLAFVIRVPHSPRTDAKAIWSVAISWNAVTGMTNGLFEGMSDTDISSVTSYISAKIRQSSHPLFLPTMVLDLIMTFYIQHRKHLEQALFNLEEPTGISRGWGKTTAWDWDWDLYRETTTHCNTIYTGLVYLERRLDFSIRLSDFILESLKFCEKENICSTRGGEKVPQIGKQIEEAVRNAKNFADGQLHQTICLQKRCQALTTIIYTIIAQQDSRANVKIAKAAKRDSTSMTAIAFLGIMFLPATLVASIFSMSIFFSQPNPSEGSFTSTSIVSKNFWLYWAITIPLTAFVITAWKYWMSVNKKNEKRTRKEPFKLERVRAYQQQVIENVEINTPFYQTKGTGPLLLGRDENI